MSAEYHGLQELFLKGHFRICRHVTLGLVLLGFYMDKKLKRR